MNVKESALDGMHKLFLEALRHREQEIFHYLAILVPALGGFLWLLHFSNTEKPAANAPQQAIVQPVVVQVNQFSSGQGGTTQPAVIQPPTAKPAVSQPGTMTPSTSGELTTSVFVTGTIGVLLLLLLGAVYSLALGYNYRYITVQLAKIESKVGIKPYMLEGWARSRRQFLARYRLSQSIPRCVRRWAFGGFRRRSICTWLHNVAWCTPPEIIKVFWWAFLLAMIGVAVAASVVRPAAMFGAILTLVVALAFAWLYAPYRYGKKLRRQCAQEPKSWPLDPTPAPTEGQHQ